MEPLIVIIVVVLALLLGLVLGWVMGGKSAQAGGETALQLRSMLDAVVVERDGAKDRLARLETSLDERERSFDEQKMVLGEAKELLSAQFGKSCWAKRKPRFFSAPTSGSIRPATRTRNG